MEFLNIQSLLDNKLNYSQFNFKNMSDDEKEMLIENLKSNINLNDNNYKKITNKENDIDKNILYHIHYLIFNDFKINDIKKIIQKVKNVYEMSTMYLSKKIENTNETELTIDNLITENLKNLSIELNEDDEREKIYIKITDKDYLEIRNILIKSYNINYNLNEYFSRFIKPLFNNKYSTGNIINDLLTRILKDNKLEDDIKDYSIKSLLNILNN